MEPDLKKRVDIASVAQVPQSSRHPIQSDQLVPLLPIALLLLLLCLQPDTLTKANQATWVCSAVASAAVVSSYMGWLVHTIGRSHLHKQVDDNIQPNQHFVVLIPELSYIYWLTCYPLTCKYLEI